MPPPTRSLLVLGGARSGKSGFAQRAAEQSGLAPLFLATGQPFDGEMADRIARHRSERGARWALCEEPLEIAAALAREARPGRIVLLDCATLWLSNLMHAGRDLDAEGAALAAALASSDGPVIVVSNEVGSGIVPDNPMARRFRDAQGRLNQMLAQACDRVVLVSAGLPLLLKPQPMPSLFF